MLRASNKASNVVELRYSKKILKKPLKSLQSSNETAYNVSSTKEKFTKEPRNFYLKINELDYTRCY